jgi:hypothetical protein
MEQTARFPKFFDYHHGGNRETLAGLSVVNGSEVARTCSVSPRLFGEP